MPWNSTAPLGSVSVKANRIIQQQNTSYIETTMGNSIVGTNTASTRDHFWNVGSNEDGRHRFVQSPAFTVGAVATDPVLGTGMDGVAYLKTILGTVQQFYRNAQGIYQTSPAVLRGSILIPTTSYTNIIAVPASCYGEIFMYTTALGKFSAQTGFFRSDAATVESWALSYVPSGDDVSTSALLFGDGASASGLNIRARRASAPSATWNYIITYRAI